MALPVPSSTELEAFHATHFSSHATGHFSQHFLGPVDDADYNIQEEEEEEDYGLGYYEDGTRRTLTDQQIAIFRHSEIEALLRARRHAAEQKDDGEQNRAESPVVGHLQTPKVEIQTLNQDFKNDGSPDYDTTPDAQTPTSQTSTKKKPFSKAKAKKAERGKQRGFFKERIKPDLRKRTWDVVDKGLGSLDYEEGNSATAPTQAAQRRRITYDDDD